MEAFLPPPALPLWCRCSLEEEEKPEMEEAPHEEDVEEDPSGRITSLAIWDRLRRHTRVQRTRRRN